MRVKQSTRIATYAAIAADELGMKPTRAGWGVREKQAQRLARLLEVEERPTNRKPKRGVQALMGRVRVERVEVEEVEIDRTIREIYADMCAVVRSMQEFAAANQPAWIESKLDRYGRGLMVMASPWADYPCPICSTYQVSELGLDRLKEDVNCIIYYAIA